jgi:hypothetical protein
MKNMPTAQVIIGWPIPRTFKGNETSHAIKATANAWPQGFSSWFFDRKKNTSSEARETDIAGPRVTQAGNELPFVANKLAATPNGNEATRVAIKSIMT